MSDHTNQGDSVRDEIRSVVMLFFLGGMLGSLALLGYQVYIWLKHGVWLGITVRDILIASGMLDVSNTGAVQIQGWAGISKICSWVVTELLNMSAILGSFFLGLIILGVAELLVDLWQITK